MKKLDMKAFKQFAVTAALLIVSSLTAFADKPDRKNHIVKPLFSIPESNWGNPDDVSVESVTSLKGITPAKAEIIGGCPDDVFALSVMSLKNVGQTTVEMISGSPEDVSSESVEALKDLRLVAGPDMVWGNDGDVHEGSVLELRSK
jgi:hypothetical protein